MTTVKERPQRTITRRGGFLGRLVALLFLVAVCWGTLLATTPSATGNPVLTTTSPGNGQLVKSPDHVLLTFDRPVPAGLATVRVLDPGTGEQVVFERPVHPGGDRNTISVPLPKERHEGTYAVSWTLPSSGLQPISGSFTFDVFDTIPPDGVPDIETTHDLTVTVFYVASRVVAIVTMLLLIGAVFFVAAIGSSAARSRLVTKLVKYSWCGLVAATLVTFVSFGPYASWAPLSGAFDPRLLSATAESDVGGALLTRLYVLVPIALGIAQLMSSQSAETTRERWMRGGTALACAAALTATWTFADPRPEGAPSPLALAVDILVLTTVAVALGGLVLLRVSGIGDRDVVSRFARLAVGCAAALAVAGVYQVLRGPREFGWLLAGTLTLAVLLVAVAAICHTWARRAPVRGKTAVREARPRLRRVRSLLLVATGVAAAVLAGTATLVTVLPSQAAHAQGVTAPVPAAIRDQVAPTRLAFDTGKPGGQGSLDLVLIPRTDERGQVRLQTYLTVLADTGTPRDDVTVTAVLTLPDHATPAVPVAFGHRASGSMAGSANLPERGRWQLAITVRTADGGTQTVTQPIDVR
ncbi:copper resistance CopC family protein [Amycolatopsis sp. GM8]|uniref:copper resistance CopC family protein n=1 Tax=Amycolatopsis sp. GM8 TaxID=2896530 RepID=UPI001F379625|nr:copper resistance CopC family protein [Amycolatopsis sp. GM8]